MVPEEKGERMGVAYRPPAEGIVNWMSALATNGFPYVTLTSPVYYTPQIGQYIDDIYYH